MLTVTREPDGCIHVKVSGKATLRRLERSGYRIIHHQGVDRVCLPFFNERAEMPNKVFFTDETLTVKAMRAIADAGVDFDTTLSIMENLQKAELQFVLPAPKGAVAQPDTTE